MVQNHAASPPSTTGSVTPDSDASFPGGPMGRTSSMPDETRHTARLRKLRDAAPPTGRPLVFTGASVSKMNTRLSRLAPPKGSAVVKRNKPGGPGFFGGDARTYERRNKRYVDRKNVDARRGGPAVFSGSSTTAYASRMLRLTEKA